MKPSTLNDQVRSLDAHIGTRLREARLHRNKPQGFVGDKVGVSFQQVQKYEAGRDRISAGKLKIIAETLKLPVDFFYDTKPPADYLFTMSVRELKEMQIIMDEYLDHFPGDVQDRLLLLMQTLAKHLRHKN